MPRWLAELCSPPWCGGVAAAVVASAVYANTLGHGFVFDDVQNIVQNRWIRSTTHLAEIFSSHAAGFDPRFVTSYYRPLMHVAYLMTYSLAGLSPAVFHAVNVLLHAAVSFLAVILAGSLLERLGPDETPAGGPMCLPLLVGLMFATHPAHTEAVAWLAGITDLSFTLFGMLCILNYLRATTMAGSLLSAVWLLLAALCKEPGVTVFLVLLCVEWCWARRSRVCPGQVLVRIGPAAGALAVYFVARIGALGTFAPSYGPHRYDLIDSILAGATLFVDYLRTLVWPFSLNALHVFRPIVGPWEPRVVLALGACLAFGVALWWATTRKVLLVAMVLVAGPLLPVLFTPVLGESVFAERYLYFPSFGFCLLAALGGAATLRGSGRNRVALGAGVLLVVGVYGVMTMSRNMVWRDSLSLWSDVVRKVPDSAVAHEYLCAALYNAGRYAEAEASCLRSIDLDTTRVDARINLGNVLLVRGDLDGALTLFDEALRRRRNAVWAWTSRGLALMAKGHTAMALESYRQALSIDPNNAEAHNLLGVAYFHFGLRADAVKELREAVRLAPDSADYRYNLDVAR